MGLCAQQDSLVLLTKNFKFQDGIFLSFDDFKQNRTQHSWDSVYAKLHTNPQKMITLVDTIGYGEDILHRKIWGFSLGGIPYVNLNKQNKAGLQMFSGLKVRGNICYFSFEETEEEVKLIKAYNPRTGIPFREGEVVIKKEVENQYMLSFETGEIQAFAVDTFLSWIQSDQKLVKTVNDLGLEAQRDKLFKCLLIYDDRNPVHIPYKG